MITLTTGQLRGLARPGVLAIRAHRGLLHGRAGVRRQIRAGAHPHRARRLPSRCSSRRCCRSPPAVPPFSAAGLRGHRAAGGHRRRAGLLPADGVRRRDPGRTAAGQQHGPVLRLQRRSRMRGDQHPALGQLYTLLVTLTFLALNGHLRLIETLVEGFRTLPDRRPRAGRREACWHVVHLGHAAVRRRAGDRPARHHRAADREPRLRRREPRGAGTEPVRGRLPVIAGVRPGDRARGPAAVQSSFHRAAGAVPSPMLRQLSGWRS